MMETASYGLRILAQATCLLLSCLAASPAAITGRLEVPLRCVAGGRVPLKLSFFDESGQLISDEVSFQLAVTGSAQFGEAPRVGTIIFGESSPFLGGRTAGGIFEIDIEVPKAEPLQLDFQERSKLGVTAVLQTLFLDNVDGNRRLWSGRTLGGAPQAWGPREIDGDAGGLRQGTTAWWSGPMEPSQDSALVSVPILVPRWGQTFLRLLHRHELERPECFSQGTVHRGARVEIGGDSGAWLPLSPARTYPFKLQSSCNNALQGQGVFGGSTAGAFVQETFDLASLAGKKGQLRLRAVTGCETCGPVEGWFVDDIGVETDSLGLRAYSPGEDPDADGATNEEEVARGSDPEAADSDGDGLPDGAESGSGTFLGLEDAGTDPTSPDTDADGVPDGIEATLGSNPCDPVDVLERPSFDLSLPAGAERRWTIRRDGTAGESGADPLAEIFTGTGGLRCLLDTAPFPEVPEAFGTRAGDSFIFGPERIGGLLVNRRLFVSRESGFLRHVETFLNVSAAPVEKTVHIESRFAQARWVEPESTSSGDGDWTVQDDAVFFNDRDPDGGMPFLAWIHGSPGARERPQAVLLDGGIARISFPLSLAPGERKSFVHFSAQGSSLDACRSTALWLSRNGREAAAGLSLTDEKEAVNMALDRDGDGIPGLVELGHGLDPDDPGDALLDPDGDGLTNLEEILWSTDLKSADTDGDGLTDGKEAKELGTDPTRGDTDRDGVKDGVDPFALAFLKCALSAERHELLGGSAAVEVRVTEGGVPFAEPVRFTLTLEGSNAIFKGPVEGGQAIAGLETSRALVEVQGGVLRLSASASSVGRKTVRLLDSELQGVLAPSGLLEDFEATDGDFVAAGFAEAWRWGEPAAGPGAASGTKVWGAGLSGTYPPNAFDTLTTPGYVLSEEGAPFFEVLSFVDLEEDYDLAAILISAGGGEFQLLVEEPLPNTAGNYEKLRRDLTPYRGKEIRLQFLLLSDGDRQQAGWYLDDFHIEGLKDSAAIDFLDGAGDSDGDGIDNQKEIEGGTNPASRDTDSDGLADGVETGTGRFVSPADTGSRPNDPDTDDGGESDGSEVKAGRNPNDALDDEAPATFSAPDFVLPFVDGGGAEWQVSELGEASIWKEDLLLFLGRLEVSDDLFFAAEAFLTYGKQILILRSSPLFLEDPLVTRKLFVSRDARMLRWLEVFENTSSKEQILPVRISSGIVGMSEPRVVRSGDGDSALDPEDEFCIYRVKRLDGDSYVAHFFRSPQSSLKPDAAGLQLGTEHLEYSLRIPAKGKVALLHFMSFSSELSDVEGVLESVRSSSPAAIAGLSIDDIDLVANYWIDSDGDRLPDAYERDHELDPADPADGAADGDQDGIASLDEYGLGTDPEKADSDGDGLTDGDEVKSRGTDPSSADTDGDGVPDATDPFPLLRLVARQPGTTLGVTGEVTRWRLRLELDDRRAIPGAPGSLDAVTLSVRFGGPVELVKTVTGEPAGMGGPDTHLLHPRNEWVVLEVRSAEAGQVPVTVEDASASGIAGTGGSLRFVSPLGDEDRDGLPAVFEADRGTDPLSSDSDGDGLSDRREDGGCEPLGESARGTLPWACDSDGGGTPDGEEISRGTDPLDPADDLDVARLPAALSGKSGKWTVLPSWAITGAAPSPALPDNAAVLRVNGRCPPSQEWARAAPDGATIRIGPGDHLGLEVHREIHASPGSPSLRFVEGIFNPAAEPATVSLELCFDFAAESDTALIATSSGGKSPSLDDRWILLRDGTGRYVLHVFFGNALQEIELPEPDMLREAFSFEVPPGESRFLIHFLLTGAQMAPLRNLAGGLLGLGEGALTGLVGDHLRGVANLPALSPVVWDRFPRSSVSPGGLWSLQGEFLHSGIEVLVGGEKADVVWACPERLVLRAPEVPGESALQVRTPAGESLHFPEKLLVAPAPGRFRRGDFNSSDRVDLTDAIGILLHLFQGGAAPGCPDAADADDSGKIDLTDAVFLLQALFQGAGPVPFPGLEESGPDPTPDGLGC